MIINTVNYEGIAIPKTINRKTYLPLHAEIEELGYVTVTFACMGAGIASDSKITRKGYMDDHGILTIQIDKNKVFFGVASGYMTLKNEK